MPFPIAALASLAVQQSQQSGKPLVGQPGSLFELQSLFQGPDPSDPNAQFKPGGSFAPPTLPALLGAFQGVNTFATLASALAPGIGQAIASLVSGPGRGQTRRAGARQEFQRTPGLVQIRQAVRQQLGDDEGRHSTQAVAQVVSAVLAQSPAAAEAFGALLQRGVSLGGFERAQGEEANALGDQLKLTFGQGTVPRPGAPRALDILAALAGEGPPTAERTLPANFAGAAPLAPADTPQGVLGQLRDFVAGTPAPSTGDPMAPTFLDSLGGAFVGSQAGSSPFNLPGGIPQGGGGVGGFLGSVLGGVLGGVLPGGAAALSSVPLSEQVRRNVGVPFADITPQGSAELFEPFRLTPSGARAQLHVQVNPASGKAEFFGPLGRPVLFSRDVAVARRVRKLASRLSSVSGLNRGRMRMRRGGR